MVNEDQVAEILAVKQKVKRKAEFFQHLSVYFVTNLLLFIINMLTSDSMWFYWPLCGWGIFVVFHAFYAFVGGFFGNEWQERQVQRELERRH